MGKDASNIDLSRYTEGNPTLPGIYDVSVYVNDQPIMSQSINGEKMHFCRACSATHPIYLDDVVTERRNHCHIQGVAFAVDNPRRAGGSEKTLESLEL